MENSRQISPANLNLLLDLIKDEIKREMNCISIGTIDSFDPTTQTATIILNYKRTIKNRNAANQNSFTDVIIPYPPLLRCPVVVLNGGGSYTTYPIRGTTYNNDGSVKQSGDTCLVLFCDRDIDLWLEKGSVQNPPNSNRMHDLSDAIALVGLSPVTKPIPNYNTNVMSSSDQTGERLTQSGFGQPYFGTVLPSGWLWCDGSAVSKTTYPFLFTVIGYTYGGSGDSFNVPDMRQRVPAGRLPGDPNFGTLGAKIGEATHTLTIPEIPSHVHQSGADPIYVGNKDGSGGTNIPAAGTNTLATGGDGAHNNIQPTFVLNWIIKI